MSNKKKYVLQQHGGVDAVSAIISDKALLYIDGLSDSSRHIERPTETSPHTPSISTSFSLSRGEGGSPREEDALPFPTITDGSLPSPFSLASLPRFSLAPRMPMPAAINISFPFEDTASIVDLKKSEDVDEEERRADCCAGYRYICCCGEWRDFPYRFCGGSASG